MARVTGVWLGWEGSATGRRRRRRRGEKLEQQRMINKVRVSSSGGVNGSMDFSTN